MHAIVSNDRVNGKIDLVLQNLMFVIRVAVNLKL
jgi:hypothetical protein